MRRTLRAAATAAALTILIPAGVGAAADAKPKPQAESGQQGDKRADKAPGPQRFALVMLNDQEVFRLASTPGHPAEHRAAELEVRLRSVLEPKPDQKFVAPRGSDVTVEPVAGLPVIRLRNQNVVTVTAADAQLNKQAREDLAQRWADDLRQSLKDFRLGSDRKLPPGFVTLATGELKPLGGGAGTAPGPEDDGQKHDGTEIKAPKGR